MVKGPKLGVVDTDEFDEIRSEGDPLAQARRATDLMSIYQQRGVELARLRKAAIERAVETQGLTYSEVAQRIGLSKGRITQIRKSAPPAERALFGVGPLTLAYPVRASDDRPSGVVAVEDSAAAEGMTSILTSLGFEVDAFLIPPGASGIHPPMPSSSAVPRLRPSAQKRWPMTPFCLSRPTKTGSGRFARRSLETQSRVGVMKRWRTWGACPSVTGRYS